MFPNQGALLSATVPRFAERGVGMSYFVGAGNQADLETFDYVRYLVMTPTRMPLPSMSKDLRRVEIH